MLASMKSMLEHADNNNYAVMAVSTVNMEICRAAITAAVEEDSPIIINISPRQMKLHADPYLICEMVNQLAKSVHVPVAVNLDHGKTMEDIRISLDAGFTSIMYDGSSLPYEENLKNTKMLTELAHDIGVSIEAELGHVGQAQNGEGENSDWYTDPSQAKLFVDDTGIDCLAVSIGTAHGKYLDDFVPKLDFDRLKQIKEQVNIPLVLHGASGAGDDNIRKAVDNGINKINVYTDLHSHVGKYIYETTKENPTIDYLDLVHSTELAAKEFIKDFIKLIKSDKRYVL